MNFKCFWTIVVIVLLFLGLLTEASKRQAQVTQRVTIESDRTNLGNKSSTALPKSESLSGNVGNLSEVSLIALEGKIKSVCVQAGLWAIFHGENYTNVGSILYTSGTPDDRACTTNPYKNGTNPQYKSIRHIGNLELSLEGISFYLGPFFTHQELYFDGTGLNLNQPIRFRSFGFTGKENWTVFEEANFHGSSACLLSAFTGHPEGRQEPYDAVVYNKDVNLTVGSVRRGCVQGSPNDDSKSVFILPTGEIKLTEKVARGEAQNVDPLELEGLLLREFPGNQEDMSRNTIFTNGEELRLPYSQTLNIEYTIRGNSNWTVFSDTNFEGKRTCFKPVLSKTSIGKKNGSEVTLATNPSNTLTLQIGSIKRGCFLEESHRQPRLLNQPKTVENFRKKNAEFYQSPNNRIFFTSFLIALGILILAMLLGMSAIFYFYCRGRRE